jgi:hypothetical protein
MVSVCKYGGIILDNELKLIEHLYLVCNRVSKFTVFSEVEKTVAFIVRIQSKSAK